MTVPVEHPLNPQLKLVASPMKLSATPVTVRRAPPLLGQHTEEVLRAAGCTADEIQALRAQAVI